MLKWVLTLSAVGAFAAAIAWYPMRGRTVLERWRAAPSATAFAERGVTELKGALGLATGPRAAIASKPQKARGKAGASSRPAQPAHPTESHTAEDRAALDRLVAERAAR